MWNEYSDAEELDKVKNKFFSAFEIFKDNGGYTLHAEVNSRFTFIIALRLYINDREVITVVFKPPWWRKFRRN